MREISAAFSSVSDIPAQGFMFAAAATASMFAPTNAWMKSRRSWSMYLLGHRPTMEQIASWASAKAEGSSQEKSSTIASCDYTVKIPMYHGVDSLNVAAASAVAFWHLCEH